MPKIKFSFEMPVTKIGERNGLTHTQKAGSLVVLVDSDYELASVLYGETNLLPVFQSLFPEAVERIYDAMETYLDDMRTAEDEAEENLEVSNF